jgi:hypothetical protein
MAGCVSRRIAWSPDGMHAAIFAGDGLHLCGPDGAISEAILPDHGLVEWFPDSHRLAVVSEVGKQTWKDLEKSHFALMSANISWKAAKQFWINSKPGIVWPTP